MAAVSKEVLGEDIEYQPTGELEKSTVSRMKNLREGFNDTIPEGSLGDKIGFSSMGQPLWSSILDEQRNMPSTAYPRHALSKVNGCIIQRPCPARHTGREGEDNEPSTWKVTQKRTKLQASANQSSTI